MKENIVQKLTSKDDKYACAFTDRIVAESRDTDEWYEYFEDVASLLDHPKSLVRNRALYILAANAQWDEENRFDLILPDYLKHITDDKPITPTMREGTCSSGAGKATVYPANSVCSAQCRFVQIQRQYASAD